MARYVATDIAVSGEGLRFGIVASRFNADVVEPLVAGALECLVKHGVAETDVAVTWIPGAWEIPLALEWLARRGDVDALVAVGAVIRGGTPHFEYVAGECSRGVADVAMRHGLPIGFGVLTCDDIDQARARAGGEHGNKGWEAAMAALEMVDVAARVGAGGAA